MILKNKILNGIYLFNNWSYYFRRKLEYRVYGDFFFYYMYFCIVFNMRVYLYRICIIKNVVKL